MNKSLASKLLNVDISGSGKPLVLVHGVAGSLRIFDPIVEQLAQHYQVARVDLLGYGHSPKPRSGYLPDDHVEALRTSLRVSGIEPPYVVVGLSMGANLVLHYARKWPNEVKGVACIGLPYFSDPDVAREGVRNNFWTRTTVEHPWLSRLFVPTAWKVLRHLPSLMRFITTIYTPAMAQETLLCRFRAFRLSLDRCMINFDSARLVADSAERRRLFIHGDDDEWSSAEAVRAALAPYEDSRLVVLEDCRHNTVLLAPSQTATLLIEYAEESWGST